MPRKKQMTKKDMQDYIHNGKSWPESAIEYKPKILMQPEFYEPIPCSNHETHREHNWMHSEFGEVECLGVSEK